jgi:hypothetical protein
MLGALTLSPQETGKKRRLQLLSLLLLELTALMLLLITYL